MNKINVEVEVRKTVNVEVDVYEVIDSMNLMQMKDRWNLISRILRQVQVDLIGMEESQKEIIKEYLKRRIELFNEQ
jgi:hypothetical protein